jgi:Tol biopolymer transport system component
VVAGDKRGPADYEAVQPPVWSPDGKHIAYAATWKFRFIVVKDDAKAEQFDAVGPPVWSPDSAKVAFAAKKEGKWYICIDHRRNETFDEILTRPHFSADSKSLAFGARKGQDIVWRVMGTE